MDCKTARLLIGLNDPWGHELAGEDAGLLQNHLASCADCTGIAEHEQQLDAVLRPAMSAIPTPIDLKKRILARLEQDERHKGRRWVRPLILAVGSLAAAVLIGWVLFGRNVHKPVPDPTDISLYDPSSAADVERYFQEVYGVSMVAPSDDQLDYRFLVDCKMEAHQNKQVPVLVFKAPGGHRIETAQVFVFSDRDFDLSKLDMEASVYQGSYHVQSLRSPNKKFAFLVLFTSDTIADFTPNHGSGVALE